MASVDRRLERLERRHGAAPLVLERAVGREALRRLSWEELSRYEAAVAAKEAGEDLTEEDLSAAARVRDLQEEERLELAPPS